MHPIEVLELSRTIHRERLAEAEQIRSYRRLRQEHRTQPHGVRHRTRRPVGAWLHAWKTA
ncbi:hypothetical protein [Isoptericola variabilis]|uniref:hypothetical protein n=1 Tax=Isoptericola variabilis TaxID=139208 RepID=UPI00030DC00A|nr:hypothetical protein [Isoptericola variabilis]TWH34135.1 hypothetical protein L600_001300000420 [Isoptericola variabilis J7]